MFSWLLGILGGRLTRGGIVRSRFIGSSNQLCPDTKNYTNPV